MHTRTHTHTYINPYVRYTYVLVNDNFTFAKLCFLSNQIITEPLPSVHIFSKYAFGVLNSLRICDGQHKMTWRTFWSGYYSYQPYFRQPHIWLDYKNHGWFHIVRIDPRTTNKASVNKQLLEIGRYVSKRVCVAARRKARLGKFADYDIKTFSKVSQCDNNINSVSFSEVQPLRYTYGIKKNLPQITLQMPWFLNKWLFYIPR